MQRRNTALNYHYFIVLLVGVLLSTISRRVEPLYVVLPLAVALLYSRRSTPVPQLTVQCQVPSLRVFEGDTLTVQVTVSATTPVGLLELWHYLPADVACPSGRHRVLCTLTPGQTTTFQHDIVLTRRGKYQLGRVFARVHTPTDLQPWLAEYPHDLLCHVYPRVAPLPRHVLPTHTQTSFGNYVSRQAGEGVEFAGIRPYTSPTLHHGITLRQAARLQTFPDWFVFDGGLMAGDVQVGNAVPIDMATALLMPLREAVLAIKSSERLQAEATAA